MRGGGASRVAPDNAGLALSTSLPMLQVMATSDQPPALPQGGRSPNPSPYAIASFRDLVEWLPLVVYIDAPDVQSKSLYISPQTTAAFGYTPEGLEIVAAPPCGGSWLEDWA